MSLSATFTFSQASLQDYADCPRRFQLRYVLDVRWPADHEGPIAEWEARAQLGSAFHRLVHQHTVGIPAEALATTIEAEDLRRWWQAYLSTPPPDLLTASNADADGPCADANSPRVVRLSEIRLSTPLAGYRLVARYDLLSIAPGQRAVIVDWKTNEKRPRRAWLEERWQTRVYRYVLVKAGAQFGEGQPWAPGQVELIYWFSNFPAQAERFPYDDGQYTEDEWALQAAIAEIAAVNETEWRLTDDLKRCRYCTYRTFCDRAKVDAEEGGWERGENEDLTDWIDLEQIAEIEF
jgi:CRISPR/Cas system-associated exonuclease Cas4 (RecB family)